MDTFYRLHLFQLVAGQVLINLNIKIRYPVHRNQSHFDFFFKNILAKFFEQFEAGVYIELAEFSPCKFHLYILSGNKKHVTVYSDDVKWNDKPVII